MSSASVPKTHPHEVALWYCCMIVARRRGSSSNGATEDEDTAVGEDRDDDSSVTAASAAASNKRRKKSTNNNSKRKRSTGSNSAQPRTYIWLARNPQLIVDTLNSGGTVREEDGVELTVELVNLLEHKKKALEEQQQQEIMAAEAAATETLSPQRPVLRSPARDQSLTFTGRSIPFVMAAPESLLFPPLCISRLDGYPMMLDQLETIQTARSLQQERLLPPLDDLRQRLSRARTTSQPATSGSATNVTPLPKRNGDNGISVANSKASHHHPPPNGASAVSGKASSSSASASHHHHHHHSGVEYKLGMFVGPLVLRKAARTFAALWGVKSRGQISRGSLGEELAGWAALNLYADMALIFGGDRPLRYHALLQSTHGDVWLVELSNRDAVASKLRAINVE